MTFNSVIPVTRHNTHPAAPISQGCFGQCITVVDVCAVSALLVRGVRPHRKRNGTLQRQHRLFDSEFRLNAQSELVFDDEGKSIYCFMPVVV